MSADALFLLFLIVAIPVSIAIALVLGALVLRIACSICRVELPGFFKAMGISVLVAAVSAIAGFALGFVLGVVGQLAGLSPTGLQIVSAVAGLPVGLLISALLYKVLLPTTLGKSVLIWLVHLLFAVAIVGILVLAIHLMNTYTDW